MFYLPFIAYWVTSWVLLHKTRDARADEVRNRVAWSEVVSSTVVSTILSMPLYYLCGVYIFDTTKSVRWWYLLLGVWLVDTFEYAMHISMHRIPYLYTRVHSVHHRIKRVYGEAALFQSSVEAAIETFGLVISFWAFGFGYSEFILVTVMAVMATVYDHTGKLTFHALHHSTHPDCNFQQPFFAYYDYLFGTAYHP